MFYFVCIVYFLFIGCLRMWLRIFSEYIVSILYMHLYTHILYIENETCLDKVYTVCVFKQKQELKNFMNIEVGNSTNNLISGP